MHSPNFSPEASFTFFVDLNASRVQASQYLLYAMRLFTGLNTNACSDLFQAASSASLQFLSKSSLYRLENQKLSFTSICSESHSHFLLTDSVITPIDGQFSLVKGEYLTLQFDFYSTLQQPSIVEFDVLVTIDQSVSKKVSICHGIQSCAKSYRQTDAINFIRTKYQDELIAAGILISTLRFTPDQLLTAIKGIFPGISLSSDFMGSARKWSKKRKWDLFLYLANKNATRKQDNSYGGIAFINNGVAKFVFLKSDLISPDGLKHPLAGSEVVIGISKLPKDADETELSVFLKDASCFTIKSNNELVISKKPRTSEFTRALTDDAKNFRRGDLVIHFSTNVRIKGKKKEYILKPKIKCVQSSQALGQFQLPKSVEEQRRFYLENQNWIAKQAA